MLLLLASCQNSSAPLFIFPASQIIDYPVSDRQFVIIAVEDHGMSTAQAKKAALERAAQVTLDHDFRYFIIVKEERVAMGMADQSDTADMPQNMYHELIIERNTNEQVTMFPPEAQDGVQPAIRLTIECSNSKTSFKKSYDAQKILQ